MEFYVSPEVVEDIISVSKSFNVDAQIVGRVETAPTKRLTLKTKFDTYEYV